MKKFIGAICSGVAGALMFLWLSLEWFVTKITFPGADPVSQGITGWNLITDRIEGQEAGLAETFKGAYTLNRVAAIVALVVACLLVAYAVVLLLKNLNVLKFNFKFNLVNNILLTVLVVAVVAAVAGVLIMVAGLLKEVPAAYADYYKAFAGVGAWLSLAFSVVACGCGWIFARKDK